MTAPELPLDAEGLRYALHGEDNESVLDSDSGIIINAGHQEDAELLRDQLNSYESRLAEQKAAALSLRDELNGVREASATELRHAYDELAECRAKLAAQIERCGLAELAVAQRDIPLAAAQAENVRLREAGRDLRLMATTQAPADHPLIVAWDRANADHGSRDALRKILRSAAVEAGRNCIETTEQLDALVARLLGEEGGQS